VAAVWGNRGAEFVSGGAEAPRSGFWFALLGRVRSIDGGEAIGVRKARFRASLPSEPDRRVSRIRLSSRWFAAERSDERLAGAVWRAPFQRSELTLPSPQLRGVITMNLD
jgi:hypothetical protein